ncbi:MAG: hypothetical protein ACO1N3_01145 [Gammaproteobacteria bacterium]
MNIWSKRYLICLFILGIALFSMGYYYYVTQTKNNISALDPFSDLALVSLNEAKLPSTIPSIRLNAKHHVFLPIELRRANLVLGMTDQDALPEATPLLDKVLFVPKKFKHQS